MFRRHLLVLSLFFLYTSVVHAALTAQEETQYVVNAMRDLVAREKGKIPAEELERRLHEILNPLFDFDQMARSCLGANWKNITPQQQREFVASFSHLLAQTYLAKIRRNIDKSEISFLPPVEKQDKVIVRMKAVTDGETVSIDYRMHQLEGRWRVYDVVIENVGLVSNYRNEFTSLLERQSFDSLLENLRTKIEKLEVPREAQSSGG
jgi:phospholipid transport system substrate-binding protein